MIPVQLVDENMQAGLSTIMIDRPQHSWAVLQQLVCGRKESVQAERTELDQMIKNLTAQLWLWLVKNSLLVIIVL